MTVLIEGMTIGLILALLTLGVYLTFRIFRMPDITADGSIALGAAVAATLLVKGHGPLAATTAAAVAGMAAGCVTGVLHTTFRIHVLLSGILVMTAVYSINGHMLGQGPLPLLQHATLVTHAETVGVRLFGTSGIDVAGWPVPVRDAAVLIAVFGLVTLAGVVLYLFLRTSTGTAMRAAGDNPRMIRALGVSADGVLIAGFGLSNSLVALSGAVLAQYQGFADVQMGIGMVVWGLASLIVGEAFGARGPGLLIAGGVIGSVLLRLLAEVALGRGLAPNDLKLLTVVFVVAALAAPRLRQRIQAQRQARLDSASA